jgi:type II secretory pathway component PulF
MLNAISQPDIKNQINALIEDLNTGNILDEYTDSHEGYLQKNLIFIQAKKEQSGKLISIMGMMIKI